jgi:hypothetical protein
MGNVLNQTPFRDDIPLFEYLRNHPLSNDRPIRVVVEPDAHAPCSDIPWSAADAAAMTDSSGHTADVIARDGITIVSYGHPAPGTDDRWCDIQIGDTWLYDVYRTDEASVQSAGWEPIVVNDDYTGDPVVVGSVGARQIVLGFPANSLTNDGFDWDNVLGVALDSQLDPEAFERRREERRREAEREFVALIREREDGLIDRIRNEIRDMQTELTSVITRQTELTRSLRERQSAVDRALAAADNPADDTVLLGELESIRRHSDVRDVAMPSGGVLSVYTDPLPMVDPDSGESTIVGEFELRFNFNSGTVHANNRTHRIDGMDHPHVRDGGWCMGDFGRTVNRLMSERQLAALVNMTIASLKTFNPQDDWGRDAYRWFDENGDDYTGEGNRDDG